jgi:DNA-binding transcriptional ArsR family regulator
MQRQEATTSIADRGPGYQLRMGAPNGAPVSVVMAPQLSVLGLLRQAVSGLSRGAPPSQLAAIRKALRPQARFATQPFTSACHSCPEICAPISPLADVSVAAQACRLRDLAADVLTDELTATTSGHGFPPSWRAAGEQPARWLNSMADASLDTWAVIESQWRAAGPLFDREVRRVGIAAVRGGMAALLNSLHPLLSYANGELTFAVPDDQQFTLGRRRLVLLPMIAGPGAMFVSFERPDVCYIGYPIRQPGQGEHTAADSALALILGPVRAAILQALRQPLAVGQLATAAQCAPTTATYHLHQLAAAGLIIREQRGTTVRVSRTLRGNELVDLLSDLPCHAGEAWRHPACSGGDDWLRYQAVPEA